MINSKLINDDEEVEANSIMIKEEDDKFEDLDIARICAILLNQVCRVDCGDVIKITATYLLDPEQAREMRCE